MTTLFIIIHQVYELLVQTDLMSCNHSLDCFEAEAVDEKILALLYLASIASTRL
ncbi:MAG: hypothetical protein IPJ43_21585 [Saprospiraceae bacterium]|nr:hypothetical protein [Saprospiraceae bacterium]